MQPSATYMIGAHVNLEIFTKLGADKFFADEIKVELRLHGRGKYDFLDSMVSLGFLKREGILEKARYIITEETKAFLDKNSPQYIGDLLEMANNRLYRFWGDLEEGLRTGKPQNETKVSGEIFAPPPPYSWIHQSHSNAIVHASSRHHSLILF